MSDRGTDIYAILNKVDDLFLYEFQVIGYFLSSHGELSQYLLKQESILITAVTAIMYEV